MPKNKRKNRQSLRGRPKSWYPWDCGAQALDRELSLRRRRGIDHILVAVDRGEMMYYIGTESSVAMIRKLYGARKVKRLA